MLLELHLLLHLVLAVILLNLAASASLVTRGFLLALQSLLDKLVLKDGDVGVDSLVGVSIARLVLDQLALVVAKTVVGHTFLENAHSPLLT